MARQRTEEGKRSGQWIAELRERHHLTQQAAAEKLKVGYRTYQAWESGESVPRWHNREKLAKLYHVKAIEILGPPELASDPSQLDHIEEMLTHQGDVLDVLALALEAELGDRFAAAVERARRQARGRLRAEDRRGQGGA